MTSFEDRKKGYEAKYLKDQETQFKIRAKRNKFLGLWAAEIIKPENIDEYVKEVRLSDLEKPGDDDIIDRLFGDFEKKSVNISREDIVQKINECQQQAIDEFMKESEVV
tara:strand:+ start:873 stop:1199 length:327 start_codon:yes stop_codon:yes gene_type:complete